MGTEPKSVKAIFDEAAEMGDKNARWAYLDGACGDDLELRRKVDALLQAHQGAGSFLEKPAIEAGADAAVAAEPSGDCLPPRPGTEGPGTGIGPYLLRERIGFGGMGTVYLAQQDKPVRRTVALKIIKPGMDSAQVVRRFQAERQALAMMDHPNIARVLDAGTTDSGRPYFVMELVRGVAITNYCDGAQLTPRERLELFVPVCQAIQHAHQKGIIHRDIKPSNVLVTLYDGKPVPKVIDFGVAKAIDQRLTEQTLVTHQGLMVGTLEYMSPEQAEAGAHGVDTRSDIYALGVLLYELLTASTPLQRATLRAMGFSEIVRRIKEEEPPKPSSRLSELRDTLASIAAQRHTEPARLAKLIRGELDWIVMRALEKDRARRYESASGLARDIERYLAGDPVEAGPPSAAYRLRKLARKHRAALLTAATFAGLLLLAAAISSYLAIRAVRAEGRVRQQATAAEAGEKRAKQAEAEAKAVLEFFQTKVLAAARPKDEDGGLGIQATVRAAVDAAEPQIVAAFRGQPETEAAVRGTLAQTYWRLGEPGLALSQLEQSRQLLRQALGPDDPQTLLVTSNIALVYRDSGREREAIALLEELLPLFRARFGLDNAKTLNVMNNLALAYGDTRRLAEAVPLLEEIFKVRKLKLGADDPSTLLTMHNLGNAYWAAGRLTDALAILEEAVALKKAKLGPEHSSTLVTMMNLAGVYREDRRIADALKLFDETLRLQKARIGPNHPETLATMTQLGRTFLAAGRPADALPLLAEVEKISRAKLGPERERTLTALDDVVDANLDLRRWPEAESMAHECFKLREGKKHLEPELERFRTMSQLGAALAGQGNYARAEPLMLEGYDGLKEREALMQYMEKQWLFNAARRLVDLYNAWGKPEKAVEWAKKHGDRKQP
jgi:serine/threonine protein kinase